MRWGECLWLAHLQILPNQFYNPKIYRISSDIAWSLICLSNHTTSISLPAFLCTYQEAG